MTDRPTSQHPTYSPAGIDWDQSSAATLLVWAGEALIKSFDYRNTLDALARIVVTDFPFADWCGIYLRGADGRFERAWVRHRDPARELWATTYLERPPASNILVDLGAEILGGTALLQPRVDEAFLGRIAQGADHLQQLQELSVSSLIIAPLRAHEQVTGAITLARCSSDAPPFDVRDKATAEDLGRRGGLAVEHARAVGQLEEQKRLIEGQLSTIAHDLRNPIGILANCASMLAEDEDSIDAEKLLAMVERTKLRALHLIDDILVVGRSAAGEGVVINAAPVPAGELIGELLEGFRPDFDRGEVDLDSQVSVDLPQILADRERVLQGLGNFVSNALKFTPKGGRVTVEADFVDGFVRFAVIDTGTGIPEADLARLFQPYARVGGAGYSGNGLGLASAKAIAEAHGGAVWVDSRPDRGSKFYMTLPVAPSPTTIGG